MQMSGYNFGKIYIKYAYNNIVDMKEERKSWTRMDKCVRDKFPKIIFDGIRKEKVSGRG